MALGSLLGREVGRRLVWRKPAKSLGIRPSFWYFCLGILIVRDKDIMFGGLSGRAPGGAALQRGNTRGNIKNV